MNQKYSYDDLAMAVETSYSVREVLRKLGIVPAGGNYKTFYKLVERLGLDTSHFTGRGHLRGKTNKWSKSTPIEDILVEHSTYCTSKLVRRLVKEGLLEYRCYKCGLVDWLGEKISLEIEHINGIYTDNRIENLTILCPNCHSQTHSFRGRNIKPK